MFSLFERIIQPFPKVEPTTPPRNLFAFIVHYCQGLKLPLLAMSLLTATNAFLEVQLFSFLGQLVDWLAAHDRQTFLTDEAGQLIKMSVVLLIIMPIITFLHAAVVHQTLLGNFPMKIRWLAHRYLLRQSLSFYQNDFAGRLATKVMQTSLSLRETVMKLLDVLVFITTYLITMMVTLAQADWRLAVPMIIWLIIYVVLQLNFVPKLKQVSSDQAEARAAMTGRIVDSYTNIATVKLFAHTQQEAEYAKDSMSGFLQTVYRQMRLATGFNVSVSILNYALIFAVSALSISLWLNNAVTIGAIAVIVSLALRLNGMAQWIMWEVGALFENLGTVDDGRTTLSAPLELIDNAEAKPIVITQGNIDFNQVSFHYGKGAGVLKDLSLTIAAGEKVGLVGRSGAGKSTLVNLLLRFHDVEAGEITIDGQNVSHIQQESLRANIGMVTQDTSLLHRSVRENILYGKPGASEAEMIAAAKKAEAHDFIMGLSDPYGNQGYDAMVGERGVKLSGGQRQRIAIARVLLKDAPILILDEATSALDSEVEAAIQHSLTKLMAGKTVIAIAHRLSTIASLDRLIVLDQGQIVEQGSHQDLIQKKDGIYAHLWAHQTGGFLGLDTETSDKLFENS